MITFIKHHILSLRHIKDILGVRRCGKTTFITEIIKDWIDSGIQVQDILLVNCDDFILKQADFDSILRAIHLISPKITHLILDEIQEKPGWESWIRTIYDLNQFNQIIVSGSNTSLLSDDLGRQLTGRHISTIITPYSFREYLWAKGWTDLSSQSVLGSFDKLQYQLEQYFIEGGFPEVIDKPKMYEKNQILLNLANDIITRDILSHYDIDAQKMNQVFQSS
jgi:predicted AAA+ superfamily ATPase